MRDQQITIAHGGAMCIAADRTATHARLELHVPVGVAGPGTMLTPGELMMAIEALAMAYATLCGARPDSAARGVNRTLQNRTRAARERQRSSVEAQDG